MGFSVQIPGYLFLPSYRIPITAGVHRFWSQSLISLIWSVYNLDSWSSTPPSHTMVLARSQHQPPELFWFGKLWMSPHSPFNKCAHLSWLMICEGLRDPSTRGCLSCQICRQYLYFRHPTLWFLFLNLVFPFSGQNYLSLDFIHDLLLFCNNILVFPFPLLPGPPFLSWLLDSLLSHYTTVSFRNMISLALNLVIHDMVTVPSYHWITMIHIALILPRKWLILHVKLSPSTAKFANVIWPGICKHFHITHDSNFRQPTLRKVSAHVAPIGCNYDR